MRRLKQLKAENARLKKLVAERDLEIEVHTMPASFGGRHCIRDCLTVEHRLPSVSNQPRFGILEGKGKLIAMYSRLHACSLGNIHNGKAAMVSALADLLQTVALRLGDSTNPLFLCVAHRRAQTSL